MAGDATFALFDGTPDAADLDRLQANVSLQEAGRTSPRDLSLNRANRSVRVFNHTVERLAQRAQRDGAMLRETGFLMRATAVYGSVKFGTADRAARLDAGASGWAMPPALAWPRFRFGTRCCSTTG